jgi:hypothetical protein
MQVRVRRIGARGDVRLRRTCEPSFWTGSLVLGGGRALWVEDVGGSTRTWTIYTAAIDDRRVRWLTELGETGGVGDYYDLAADGPTRAFAWATVDFPEDDEPTCWEDDVPCRYAVVGGRARRVVGRTSVRIPGVPPPVDFDASAGRIAVVPADRTIRANPVPRAVADGPVEIRDAESGTLVTSFAPTGRVWAVALAGRSAAVLVARADGKRIERYDAVTGALRGARPVPANTATDLDVAGTRVVYRVGRAIRLFDSARAATSRLWTPRRTPMDVSIEGRRVVWATNSRRGGRIVALTIPRR